MIRNESKWTISTSGGIGPLQMVSNPDTDGMLVRTLTPKKVDCEISHRLKRETIHFFIRV